MLGEGQELVWFFFCSIYLWDLAVAPYLGHFAACFAVPGSRFRFVFGIIAFDLACVRVMDQLGSQCPVKPSTHRSARYGVKLVVGSFLS